MGFNCNRNVSIDYIQLNGFIQYMFENLYPYSEYLKWGDPQNVDTVRALYAKRTPFPFNFYSPKKYVQRTNDITEHLANFSTEDIIEKHDIAEMSLNAKKCLNWISEKIGDKKWFFGDKPSECDAIIYGYLSVILHMKLPNNVLQVHLQQCSNLVKYVHRITKAHFADLSFCSPDVKPTDEKHIYTGKEDEESPEVVRRRYYLSGLVAVLGMVGFAVMNGIVSVRITYYIFLRVY
jgi:metaxin